MAENDMRFERENLAVTTSFSQLLFADADDDDDPTRRSGFDRIFYADKTPKMLCFGDFAASNYKGETVLFTETTTTTTTTNKSSVTCSDSSSSANSSAHNNIGVVSKSNTRKRGGGPDRDVNRRLLTSTTTTTSKKTKSENPSNTVPPTTNNNNKRKEKLGERIAALQQLVSPFGKTDTASVLHEAMGYIRFLQEQVQVLCSPYLQRFPNSLPSSENERGENLGGIRKDLRSRGLCLVPVEFTEHVANDNGADLWSPAMAGHVASSSPAKQ